MFFLKLISHCLPTEPNELPSGWGQAVRIGDYTAICLGPKPSGPAAIPCANPLLYNLANDPGQQHNIAAQHPNIVTQALNVMKMQHTTGHYCGGA